MRTNKKQTYPQIDIRTTGMKIKFYMKLKNISAKQLQEYLGLSCVQSIYRWLEGVNLPSVDNLYAMSRLFQVEVDDILCGNRQINKKSAVDAHRSRQFNRLVTYYQRFDGFH